MHREKAASWGRQLAGTEKHGEKSSDVQTREPDSSSGAGALDIESTSDRQVTAFSDLYERHLSPIYNYLRSRTGSDEDAADLTQQTFMQALHAFPKYIDRGLPIEVWLFRIARNLAVATYRQRIKRGHGHGALDLDLLPERLQPVASGAEEPEAIVLRNETRLRLRALLMELDPDKRELLVLRFVSRLTAKEIAQVVGKSEAAVQKQLTRILHALKEQYDED